jgi:hypothetical protein
LFLVPAGPRTGTVLRGVGVSFRALGVRELEWR